MTFLLLFWDMNNIYTFSHGWYAASIIIDGLALGRAAN